MGHHLANRLNKKHDVIVYDDLSTGKQERLDEGIEFVKGDITEIATLSKAMNNCDIVFHEAAFVSVRGSFDKLYEEARTNVIGTLNVFKTAKKYGVKKVIQASSMAVYGVPQELPVTEETPTHPISPYGNSKLRAELYADVFSEYFPVVSLRYSNIYGEGQTPNSYVGVITTFIDKVLNNKPMTIFGSGLQTRDFVWVDDIVQANIKAMKKGVKGVYSIGAGKEYSVFNLAEMIQKEIGGEINFGKPAPGDIDRIYYDIKKATKELEFTPKGKLEDILPKIIEEQRGKRQ